MKEAWRRLDAPIKAKWALLAFVILAVGTYVAIRDVVDNQVQTTFANQYNQCLRSNIARADQYRHLVKPVKQFIQQAVNTRTESAQTANATDRATDIHAATKYAQIKGTVEGLPQQDCAALVQRP